METGPDSGANVPSPGNGDDDPSDVAAAAATDTPSGGACAADQVWRLLTDVLMVRKEEFPALAASFGLNPGAMHALLQLDPAEPQSMSSLAGAWKCDASNVTWLVDRLEEHGLAERRAHPGDRRIRTVALTEKGAAIRTQVETRMYEAPESLRALGPRDLETLGRILRKIAPRPAARH